MKVRACRAASLIALVLLALAACTRPQKAVLLIARETSEDMGFMIEQEVKPILDGLTAAGYMVVVASQSGKTITDGPSVLKIQKRLASVKAEDYIAVIVPCMAAGGTSGETPPEAVTVLKKTVALGRPLAAQQSGVALLAKAGALSGRKFAIAEDSRNVVSDGIYIGTGVAQDGNVLTSGTCPYMAKHFGGTDGTGQLVSMFVSMLK